MANQDTALILPDNHHEIDVQRMEEFGVDASTAREIQKIQGSIIIAQRFKRNEDDIYQALMTTCKRTSFALRGEYAYKRGSKKDEETGKWVDNIVSGPSVYLSRAAIRLWGNCEIGTMITRDTEDERQIRSEVWDMQTNVRRFAEASFRKLIQRKKKDASGKNIFPAVTEWVRPDERDLRELTNKHAAICERNAAIQLLPDDMIQDAREMCRATLMNEAEQDPAGSRKKVVMAFGELNVPVTELEKYLGHPLAQCSPSELTDLRQVYAAIKEGASTWAEVLAESHEQEGESDLISEEKAVEFFTAWKGAGKTQQQVTAWLKENFKITDGRKIPASGFEVAIAWARGSAQASAAKTGEVISPNAEAVPAKGKPAEAEKVEDVASKGVDALFPEVTAIDETKLKRINQLFEILGTPKRMQAQMLKDYANNPQSLIDMLEKQLEQ